jgi:hypothetical protein
VTRTPQGSSATVAVCAAGMLFGMASIAFAQQSGIRSSASSDHRLLERYDGHLTSGDGGFSLTLNHDGTASSDWTRPNGTVSHFAGSYTGTDGNYSVKLGSKSGEAAAADALSLTTRSTGGMVTAQYAEGARVKRNADSLRLMEVDSGDAKLKSTRAGTSSRASSRHNSRSSHSAARAAATRARRVMSRAPRAAGTTIHP